MKNKELENQLIEPMINHLTGNGIDLAQDYTEIALDSFLNYGLLKDVPLVGTAFKLGQSVLTLRNLIMARNYYIFISELRKNKKIDEELQEHLRELGKDPKKLRKEIEMLLIYIERYQEEEKAQYMANIYCAYLNHTVSGINWDTTVVFLELLDRVLLRDIHDFERVFAGETSSQVFNDHSGLLRLSALGLLQYFNGKEEPYGYNKNGLAKVTCQGKVFYRIIKQGKAI